MNRTLSALLLTCVALAGVAGAQEAYPTRPVTIVVPFPPGGIADLTARPLAPALERVLKQPVVVANKAGAAGAVGMQSVAIARPDGYTVMVALVSISTIRSSSSAGCSSACRTCGFASLTAGARSRSRCRGSTTAGR